MIIRLHFNVFYYSYVIEYYRIHRDLNSILHIKIFYINYITINTIFLLYIMYI